MGVSRLRIGTAQPRVAGSTGVRVQAQQRRHGRQSMFWDADRRRRGECERCCSVSVREDGVRVVVNSSSRAEEGALGRKVIMRVGTGQERKAH